MADVTRAYGSVSGRRANQARVAPVEAVKAQRFATIILDRPSAQEHEAYYEPQGPVFADEDVLWPVTGWNTRPETLYAPRATTEVPQP